MKASDKELLKRRSRHLQLENHISRNCEIGKQHLKKLIQTKVKNNHEQVQVLRSFKEERQTVMSPQTAGGLDNTKAFERAAMMILLEASRAFRISSHELALNRYVIQSQRQK